MPAIVQSNHPVAHDDIGFVRPQAWDEAKAAFGIQGDIATMMTLLERCRVASPRLLLAAAIHAFLNLEDAERSDVVRSYLTRHDLSSSAGERREPTNGHDRPLPVSRPGRAKRDDRPGGGRAVAKG